MKHLVFSKKTIPFAFLLTAVLSYGLLIPWLGFYWDDWPAVLVSWVKGAAGYPAFLGVDRPLSAWIYMLTTPILGQNPLVWQIFSLLARWICVLSFWWMLRLLWPDRFQSVTWMALVFLVYPGFLQQPIAWIYSHTWLIYAIFLISLATMLLAIRKPRQAIPLTVLSMVTSILNLFTTEYFFGLELIRPILLWVVCRRDDESLFKTGKKVIIKWLPYLIVAGGFVFWRFGIFGKSLGGDDPNSVGFLKTLLADPKNQLVYLIQFVIKDVTQVVFTTWSNILKPELFDFSTPFTVLSWIIAIVFIFVIVFYLCKLDDREESPYNQNRKTLTLEIILIGLIGVLSGGLPVWATDRQIILGFWADRFVLAPMFGAAILLVGIVEAFAGSKGQKIVLLSIIISLSVGANLRNSNSYRWLWTIQQRFYWQLKWRAPDIKPGTAILVDDLPMYYVADYSIAAAVNSVYSGKNSSIDLDYWFFKAPNNAVPVIEKNRPIEYTFRAFKFEGSTDQTLAVYSKIPRGCLWVLGPGEKNLPELTETMVKMVSISNLNQILPAPDKDDTLLEEIFGKEPDHNWCYYFEKADLARQLGNWQDVDALWEVVEQNGYEADRRAMYEYFPFIEGLAHNGELDKAIQLAEKVTDVNGNYGDALCSLWKRVAASGDVDEKGMTKIKLERQKLDCANQ